MKSAIPFCLLTLAAVLACTTERDKPVGIPATSNQDVAAATAYDATRPVSPRPPNTVPIQTPEPEPSSPSPNLAEKPVETDMADNDHVAAAPGIAPNTGDGSGAPVVPRQIVPGAPLNANPTSNDPCNRVPACYSKLQRDLCTDGRGDCLANLQPPAVGDDLRACTSALAGAEATARPFMPPGYRLPDACK